MADQQPQSQYGENFVHQVELPGMGGLNVLDDAEFIADNELELAQNVVYNNGVLAPRPGSYLFASKPAGETAAGVQCFDPKTSDGVNFFATKYGTNYYLWDNVNSGWIKINGSYAPSNTDTDGWITWDGGYGADVIYGGNGKDVSFKWQMCFNTIAVQTANSDGTITLVDATRFPTSGTLLVQDGSTLRSYTITGVSGNVVTISGTVGHVIAVGAGVTLAMVDISASVPKGRIFTTSAGRLLIFNKYQAESLAKWSVVGNAEDFATTTGPNGAGSRSVNDEGGEIRAAMDFGSFVAVCKDSKLLQFTIIISSDLTSNYGSFQPAADGESLGPVAKYVAVKAQNALWYPTASQGITKMVPTSTGTSFSIGTDTQFAEKVLPLCTSTYSFLNGRSKYFNQMFFFAAGIPSVGLTTSPNSTAVKNTDVLVYDTTFQGWAIWKGWGVQDWANYNQTLLFLSNTDGNIYQAFVGHDDNGQGYLVDAVTKKYNDGSLAMPKTRDKVFVKGVISKGGLLNIMVTFEMLSGVLTQLYLIDSADERISFPSVLPLGGGAALGAALPLGGGVNAQDQSADDIIKGTFAFYLDVSAAIGHLTMQLEAFSEDPGTYWELKVLASNPMLEAAHPVEYDLGPEGSDQITSVAGSTGGASLPAAGNVHGVEVPQGTIDGLNKTFTVNHTPQWISNVGTDIFENFGYTRSGLTITFDVAPRTGAQNGSGQDDVLRSVF